MIFITLLSEKTKKGDPAHNAPVSLWMPYLESACLLFMGLVPDDRKVQGKKCLKQPY